jgi:cytochrome c553
MHHKAKGQRMKKITIFSIATITMLVTGCNNSTVKEVTVKANEATTKAVEVAKEKATEVAKEAKEKAAEAMEAAKKKAEEVAEEAKGKATRVVNAAKEKAAEAVEVAKTKAHEAADATKEKVAEATETVKEKATGMVDEAKGKSLYAKCAGCHGADGKTKALGKSAPIAGVEVDVLIADLKGYREGTLNKNSMGGLMKGQAASLTDEDIQALATYISALK